jgi:hypothetical protein
VNYTQIGISLFCALTGSLLLMLSGLDLYNRSFRIYPRERNTLKNSFFAYAGVVLSFVILCFGFALMSPSSVILTVDIQIHWNWGMLIIPGVMFLVSRTVISIVHGKLRR